jgi:hypothetical protein
MIRNANTELDCWEAWIEFDSAHPRYFGTLYVVGEVRVDKGSRKPTVTKTSAGLSTHLCLSLNLTQSKSQRLNSLREVIYSEPISNINQYRFINVYEGTTLIGKIGNIEVVV